MFAFFLTFVAVGQALIGIAANTDAITEIPVGSSLHSLGSQTSWLSPSGRFAFGFYPDGQGFSIGINMSVSPEEHLVIWTAAGDQDINHFSKDAVLSFTEQGFVLTLSNEAKPITLISFDGTKPTVAAMLDSGNFMVYGSDPSSDFIMNCSSISVQVSSGVNGDPCIIWQSFDNPTDTMMGGQVLPCGTNLISRQNTTDYSFYQLSMQCDSNLVIYANKETADGNNIIDSSPIWASMTYKKGYDRLILSEGGHLFLSNVNGTNPYTLSPDNPEDTQQQKMLYYATQMPNKYFRLFALNLVTNRSTNLYQVPTLYDDCQSKSLCGMNSYCVLINDRAQCRCLPSFNFDSPAPAEGCQRSKAVPNCWPPGSSDTTAFLMEPVEDLVWYDDAYSIVSTDTKEDCSSSCLSECDCEAAVYFNQNCAKHKLPMSHATKGSNLTTGMSTAFIKISAEGSGGKTEEKQWMKRHLMAVLLCGAIDAGVFLALLAAGAGSYWLFYGRYRLLWRKWELAFQEEVAPRSFSFEELAKATNSFATELGKGGHATVFKGDLTMYGRPNPIPVAVKRLSVEEGKGDTDFQTEIRIIGRAHHVNLVRLLGFCYEEYKRLLIYEYMSRGSLADLIRESVPPSWKQQAKILLGVARGLNYLHRECETKIIHRDIKPENILIAENWVVKISDFGISKLSAGGLPTTSTKRTSAPGTPGYVAPECIQSKGENLTEKADVYSFGIVVLETVFWERNTQDNNLLQSAHKYCKDIKENKRKNVKLADAELEKARMVKLGMLCVQEIPDARPYMEDVILSMLEWVLPAPSATAAVTPQTITTGKKVSWAPLVK